MIGRDGDWVKILLPARVGYVAAAALSGRHRQPSPISHQQSIGSVTGGSGNALTPDGNLTLIDDYVGTSAEAGKQFITLEKQE
ncbi:MAG: hypothetical protein ACLSHJ_00810 [Oscillospiraceae bacterium]